MPFTGVEMWANLHFNNKMTTVDWKNPDNLRRLVAPLDSNEFKSLFVDFPQLNPESTRRTRNRKISKIKSGNIVVPDISSEYAINDDVIPANPKVMALQLAEAKKQLKRTQHQLDESRDGKLEYMAALTSAATEAFDSIKLEIPKAQHINYKGMSADDEEVVVVNISDLQLGKVTATYNMEICAARMKVYAQKVLQTARIQSTHHPIRTVHLQLLGDIVEGENIFPNQAYQIAAGNYRQVNYGWGILTQFIVDMLTFFDKVHVVGVIGNHGRISGRGGDIDPETNMDRMLYDRVRGTFDSQVFHEPRVTFDIPDGTGLRSWYAVDRIGDWGFMMAHGDQINGWAGIPFYGAKNKALGWIDAIDEPWDYLMLGHFHTPTTLTYGKRKVYFNGSTESSNEFAQERIASIGYPTQNMFLVHPVRGITAQYEVKLEDTPSNLARTKATAAKYSVI